MHARPCSGSRPKVNGSTTITVMVMVIPGSAPPITPINVPMKSGTRYFTCIMSTSPAPKRSNISARTSEVRPAAARQQHGEIALKHVVHDHRGDQRDQPCAGPTAKILRKIQQRVGRGD